MTPLWPGNSRSRKTAQAINTALHWNDDDNDDEDNDGGDGFGGGGSSMPRTDMIGLADGGPRAANAQRSSGKGVRLGFLDQLWRS